LTHYVVCMSGVEWLCFAACLGSGVTVLYCLWAVKCEWFVRAVTRFSRSSFRIWMKIAQSVSLCELKQDGRLWESRSCKLWELKQDGRLWKWKSRSCKKFVKFHWWNVVLLIFIMQNNPHIYYITLTRFYLFISNLFLTTLHLHAHCHIQVVIVLVIYV